MLLYIGNAGNLRTVKANQPYLRKPPTKNKTMVLVAPVLDLGQVLAHEAEQAEVVALHLHDAVRAQLAPIMLIIG